MSSSFCLTGLLAVGVPNHITSCPLSWFFAILCNVLNKRPVYSWVFSANILFCPPLLPTCGVPFRIIFANTDDLQLCSLCLVPVNMGLIFYHSFSLFMWSLEEIWMIFLIIVDCICFFKSWSKSFMCKGWWRWPQRDYCDFGWERCSEDESRWNQEMEILFQYKYSSYYMMSSLNLIFT